MWRASATVRRSRIQSPVEPETYSLRVGNIGWPMIPYSIPFVDTRDIVIGNGFVRLAEGLRLPDEESESANQPNLFPPTISWCSSSWEVSQGHEPTTNHTERVSTHQTEMLHVKVAPPRRATEPLCLRSSVAPPSNCVAFLWPHGATPLANSPASGFRRATAALIEQSPSLCGYLTATPILTLLRCGLMECPGSFLTAPQSHGRSSRRRTNTTLPAGISQSAYAPM